VQHLLFILVVNHHHKDNVYERCTLQGTDRLLRRGGRGVFMGGGGGVKFLKKLTFVFHSDLIFKELLGCKIA
jgi:hypothetical protein